MFDIIIALGFLKVCGLSAFTTYISMSTVSVIVNYAVKCNQNSRIGKAIAH